ncbi:Hypothetical_protein [Hexamita inflata]|uniref:Hypothetical_protein n=1 Tax=Hexamita inflata TaxID=28002 RepID=A0ABP1J4Y1_9EUKA
MSVSLTLTSVLCWLHIKFKIIRFISCKKKLYQLLNFVQDRVFVEFAVCRCSFTCILCSTCNSVSYFKVFSGDKSSIHDLLKNNAAIRIFVSVALFLRQFEGLSNLRISKSLFLASFPRQQRFPFQPSYQKAIEQANLYRFQFLGSLKVSLETKPNPSDMSLGAPRQPKQPTTQVQASRGVTWLLHANRAQSFYKKRQIIINNVYFFYINIQINIAQCQQFMQQNNVNRQQLIFILLKIKINKLYKSKQQCNFGTKLKQYIYIQ